MTGKRIVFYILAAFITGNILLIYIQHNSVKNINTLIDGNEKVLAEIDVINNLRELKRDINSVEGNIGDTVHIKDSLHQQIAEEKIKKVQFTIDNLQKISDDDSSVKYIDLLDLLIQEKLAFAQNTVNINRLPLKDAIGISVMANKSKLLNDSINLVTHLIENSRKKVLDKVISSIVKSGKNALNLGTILIIIVLLSGVVLCWFVINRIRNQSSLIHQLNNSEKKVRESAQAKEKFITNMSHEIRTPMNAILGFTNLLQNKSLDEESKEYIQTIQRSGENLLTIINDVLDLSKIEAGMMNIESVPFNIRALVHSAEIMFTAKAVEKKLQISVVVEESVPDTLEGDSKKLMQILVNLIGNSLKFTNKGTILIKISNEGSAGSIIKAGITVSDTGIGIEKEKLQHIFERFQQVEDSVTRKYGGTGLGLSIVNDLVLLQKGNIKVKSEYGKGTSFYIMIPYKIFPGYISLRPSTEIDDSIKSNFEDICVLVVEDNEINQSLIKHLFKSWQLEFELANNGKEAIGKLQTKKYDLILMDIQMPEMDGYTATREIREKLKLNTPIIAMTAHALVGEKEKCLSYGMDEYISKPIQEEQLHKLITRFAYIRIRDIANIAPLAKAGQYKYIRLQYMKAISLGNTEYEKSVTQQFMEAIPEDLFTLGQLWRHHDIDKLRQVAHNMKTTVSVMGLNEVLNPFLDAIEYANLDEESFRQNFFGVNSICDEALKEAKHFYSTF